MKWTESQTIKLKELCAKGKNNRLIAAELKCDVKDIYAKRSQLGITIDKCKAAKGIALNPEFEAVLPTSIQGLRKEVKQAFFEEALPPIKTTCLSKGVKRALKDMDTAILLAITSDNISMTEAYVYANLQDALTPLKHAFDDKLKACQVEDNK
ncbi:MAG: hypothetical protein PHD60_07190 [Clostridia bacterium]|nr:hypothetical protein [Clostridia bacterium]